MHPSRRSLLLGGAALSTMALSPKQEQVLLDGSGPSLNLNFLSGSLDQRITFTRASAAWEFDSSGTLTQSSTDVPRFGYAPSTLAPRGMLIEEARTNSLRNSSMTGAAVGTPGTLPTNWGVTLSGLTQTIVGTGTESGIPYVDIRLNGTTSAAGFFALYFETTAAVAASTGQTWTLSLFYRLTAGSLTNVTSSTLALQEYASSGGSFLQSDSTTVVPSGNAALATQRLTATATLAQATVTSIRPTVAFFCGTGVAIDLTIRIGAPQLELGGFVTSPVLTTSAAVTRAVDSASMPIGGWFSRAAQSALCICMEPALNSADAVAYEFDDGASAQYAVYLSNATPKIITSSGLNASIAGTISAGAVTKLAGAFGPARQSGSFNGGIATAGASALPAGITTLRFGSRFGSGQRYSGYIQRFLVWNRILSDGQLQAVSR